MFTLVYTSEETWPMSRQDLLLILSQSRRSNVEHDITGLLLYHEGRFLQVLEGNQKNIKILYKNISNDSRNKNVVSLMSKDIAERNFPNWTMAFVSITEQEKANIPGFSDFFEPEFNVSALVRQPDEIFELLCRFERSPKLEEYVET